MSCMKDLPVDVLSKIVSYKIGDPKYLKIKHSEALTRIPHKYKISRLGPKITRIYLIEYCIVRDGVPFSLTSIEDIVTNRRKRRIILFNL